MHFEVHLQNRSWEFISLPGCSKCNINFCRQEISESHLQDEVSLCIRISDKEKGTDLNHLIIRKFTSLGNRQMRQQGT